MTHWAAEFFATARERQAIYLRRQAGQPWPWTDDPTMRQYSITNVFRENDKTTRWFTSNVREPLRSSPDVLLATVLFRWFNRIRTGEAIFKKVAAHGQDGGAVTMATAWDCRGGRARDWVQVLKDTIVHHCGGGPYVTGSYIILGQQGMPKLDGVLACIEQFCIGEFSNCGSICDDPSWPHRQGTHWATWEMIADALLRQRGQITLEEVWRWLRQVPYLGDFMAYEIVTDLRWTDLLDRAPDILTWANPGPGAARGLARLHGRPIEGRKIKKPPKQQMIVEMRELLALSQKSEFWPQWSDGQMRVTKNVGDTLTRQFPSRDAWPAWELHEVEMWLCETDKILRARSGQGRPRGIYRPK